MRLGGESEPHQKKLMKSITCGGEVEMSVLAQSRNVALKRFRGQGPAS
jgi:hypothetical protein